jgi:hypothetical protein
MFARARVLREQPAGARHQTDEQNGGYPSRAADLVRLLIEGARRPGAHAILLRSAPAGL